MEKELYSISGVLNKGFRGHISFTSVLPDELDYLHIVFTFDKRDPDLEDVEMKQACLAAAQENNPEGLILAPMGEFLAKMPKSEMNCSVFIDDVCVGSAHRNVLTKEIMISTEKSSEGFIPYRPKGVIRVVIHVQNVLHNGTNYTLQVLGGKE